MSDEINITKASPVVMRKSLEVARKFYDLGIEFVPVPALSGEDRAELIELIGRRLDIIAKAAEEAEKDGS